MHVHFLDPHRPLASPIHLLDARVKVVLTLAFIVTCSLTPTGTWPVYMVLMGILVSVEILSGLGVMYVLRRSALALPFVLAAFPVMFTTEGHSIAAFHIGATRWVATAEGVVRFVSIVIKSWLSVQAALMLAATTAFPALLVALRALHIPRLLVALFGLMWRYLFVLVDEATRLIRARASRSGQAAGSGLRPGGTLGWRARVTGGMAGNLLLRSFERSERIYAAMVSRGYDGETRSLPPSPIAISAWATLAAGLAVLFLLVVAGFLLRS